MPRGKGFRRSRAAKRRNAERVLLTSSMDLAEVMPPLEKKASSSGSTIESLNFQNFSAIAKNLPMTSNNLSMASNNCSMVYNNLSIACNNPSMACNNLSMDSNNLPMCSSLDVDNSDYFPQRVLQGSFHQGDSRFGFNSGRQCAANSITAVLMSVLKDVLTWTTEDLDAVLLHGDELYTSMDLQGKINDSSWRGYVAVAELPTVHTLFNTTFSIKMSDSLSGVFGNDVYVGALRDVSMSIEDALQRALFQSDARLLNIYGYICAVVKVVSTFAVVDSHSRDDKGMVKSNAGTSVVVYCDDIYMLFNHVDNLATSLKGQGESFEVTGVTVIGKATTAGTNSCTSGQQDGVTEVSALSAPELSECTGDHGKQTCRQTRSCVQIG